MRTMRVTRRVERLIERCYDNYCVSMREPPFREMYPTIQYRGLDFERFQKENPNAEIQPLAFPHYERIPRKQQLQFFREIFSGIEVGKEEVIGFMDNFHRFQDAWANMFNYAGQFVSKMIHFVFLQEGRRAKLEIDLPSLAPVHVPDHYIATFTKTEGEDTSPCIDLHELDSYYRTNLLLIHLGDNLSMGTLILNGNLGSFFAYGASSDALIVLNGECGWRGCSNLMGARVKINGIAGHGILESARYGKVYVGPGVVNGLDTVGQIRSLSTWTKDVSVECHLNGRRVYPKTEGPYGSYTYDPSQA